MDDIFEKAQALLREAGLSECTLPTASLNLCGIVDKGGILKDMPQLWFVKAWNNPCKKPTYFVKNYTPDQEGKYVKMKTL